VELVDVIGSILVILINFSGKYGLSCKYDIFMVSPNIINFQVGKPRDNSILGFFLRYLNFGENLFPDEGPWTNRGINT
jgi:hypothetical protein